MTKFLKKRKSATGSKKAFVFIAATLFLIQMLLPQNVQALAKCPATVLKATKVATPMESQATLEKYVSSKLNNKIKSIQQSSIYREGSWWSAGFHYCYFEDKNVKSGFSGFLPTGVKSGYVTAVTLSKEMISGGNTLFIRYYKQNGKWKVYDSGTSP